MAAVPTFYNVKPTVMTKGTKNTRIDADVTYNRIIVNHKVYFNYAKLTEDNLGLKQLPAGQGQGVRMLQVGADPRNPGVLQDADESVTVTYDAKNDEVSIFFDENDEEVVLDLPEVRELGYLFPCSDDYQGEEEEEDSDDGGRQGQRLRS